MSDRLEPCKNCGKIPQPGEWHNNRFISDGISYGPICGLPDGEPGPGISSPPGDNIKEAGS